MAKSKKKVEVKKYYADMRNGIFNGNVWDDYEEMIESGISDGDEIIELTAGKKYRVLEAEVRLEEIK